MAEERIYFWSAYVIIAIVVFIPMLFVMEKLSNGDTFNEELIVNELGLISDVLFGFNEDVYVEYFMIDNYFIEFTNDCKFSISSSSRYFCADDLNLDKGVLENGEFNSIILKNEGNKFSVLGVVK
ncbi:hypothetical protein HN865_02490 [Candidatus Woesearchaeota archaeon]|jgi:hypothetical protein|nr:hypothetical protein [Cryomorphaceae bacterium]MBT7237703.1 hypothetical protein [Candidatus Woesearchaeota archaeon]